MATLVFDLRIHPFVVPTTIFLDVTHRGLVLALWHVRESEDIAVLGSICWPSPTDFKVAATKRSGSKGNDSVCFWLPPSPTNFFTLCKPENDVVHNVMSNALLLITQQRHRRKN